MPDRGLAVALIAVGAVLGVLALVQAGLDVPDDILTLIFLGLGGFIYETG